MPFVQVHNVGNQEEDKTYEAISRAVKGAITSVDNLGIPEVAITVSFPADCRRVMPTREPVMVCVEWLWDEPKIKNQATCDTLLRRIKNAVSLFLPGRTVN